MPKSTTSNFRVLTHREQRRIYKHMVVQMERWFQDNQEHDNSVRKVFKQELIDLNRLYED